MPVSTECAAALLSFRYPCLLKWASLFALAKSIYYFTCVDYMKQVTKIQNYVVKSLQLK